MQDVMLTNAIYSLAMLTKAYECSAYYAIIYAWKCAGHTQSYQQLSAHFFLCVS